MFQSFLNVIRKKWIFVVELCKNNKWFIFISDGTDVLAFCAGEFLGYLSRSFS